MGEEQTEGGKRSAPRWTQTATTLAGIVSVFLVALGLYITNAQNRAQQQLTEQGQITERFGRAIDQLGSDKLDVRLGGVYALEALMHEPHADERNIIEVLSAYVRDHPASTAGPLTLHRRGDLLPTRKLPTDVQAALTVLGRRPDPAHNTGIDLTGAHISGADLRGADLRGADLTSADLTGVRLDHANLSRARLLDTRLYGVNLTGARLNGTDIAGARQRPPLWWRDAGADFTDATWPSGVRVPYGWSLDPETGRLTRDRRNP
jgi:hypothetical protein